MEAVARQVALRNARVWLVRVDGGEGLEAALALHTARWAAPDLRRAVRAPRALWEDIVQHRGTEACDQTRHIHERMPVILEREQVSELYLSRNDLEGFGLIYELPQGAPYVIDEEWFAAKLCDNKPDRKPTTVRGALEPLGFMTLEVDGELTAAGRLVVSEDLTIDAIEDAVSEIRVLTLSTGALDRLTFNAERPVEYRLIPVLVGERPAYLTWGSNLRLPFLTHLDRLPAHIDPEFVAPSEHW